MRTGPLLVVALAASALPLSHLGCAGPHAATPAPASVAATPPPAAPRVVARVDGVGIDEATLAAHVATSGLGRDEALDDVVDLQLLRAAAARDGVALPAGAWSPADRARVEVDVARKRGIDLPGVADTLVVDHAWVKDDPSRKVQAAQRAALDKLRALVAAGDSIPAAYPKLNVKGTAWHIGDHEEYPYDVVSPGARDLPPGGLSPVLPGDGGLHLFKIHERKKTLPPADAVHAAVRDRLRDGAAIEKLDAN